MRTKNATMNADGTIRGLKEDVQMMPLAVPLVQDFSWEPELYS